MTHRTLPIALLLLCLSCSGATSGEGARAADDEGESGDGEEESYTETVQPLTPAMVRQSLLNMGCQRINVLEWTRLDEPAGMVLVMTSELCEGYVEQGPSVMLVTSVGNEYLHSNTLHSLPGIGGRHAETAEVLELRVPRVRTNGASLVYLRYRVPPSSESGRGNFVERVVVGTFSAEALELTVVQPVRFSITAGSSRFTGEGQVELIDTDSDGDLDIRLDLTARGVRCGRGPCRNGEHRCQQVNAWTGRHFDDTLEGDDCLFLGQLEL